MKIFHTVRTRLTLWYVGVLALVLLSFSAGLYAQLARSINERLDDSLRATLVLMAETLTRDLAEGLVEVAELKKTEGVVIPEDVVEQEVARGVVDDLNFPQQATAIFAAGGRLLAEKPARDGLRASLSATPEIADQTIHLFTLPAAAPAGLRAAAQRVSAPTKGSLYLIVVAQSLATNAAELHALRRIFSYAVPLALLFAGLSGYFLARKSLAPVAAMSERARQITANSLAENLPENPNAQLPVANPHDELGQLATAFNKLLARLQTSLAQQRQFMADASHELRTPLSVIHTTTEITLEHSADASDNGQECREALTAIQRQSQRLIRLVEDMFTLARADAGRRPLHHSVFYLDELLVELAEAARVLATRKEITIAVASLAETLFRGDEDLLRQMLLNLLDNAIRHTPTGGRVCLSLTQNDSAFEITVADNGAGIPLAAQPHIFERFYRADESRSRAADGGGAGLGLSIARWIAEAHNGRLELRRSDASGSVFAVTLPVRQP